MKRLASRSTWWHILPHKSIHAVNAAERRGQPWTILAWTSTRGKVRSASSRRPASCSSAGCTKRMIFEWEVFGRQKG